MIVPAMTLEEIRKQVQKDEPIVERKAKYTFEKLKKVLKPRGAESHIRFLDYTAPSKNTWLIHMNMTKKDTLVQNMLYYYDDRGLKAIVAVHNYSGVMFYFTAHFFQRYNERRKLNLVLPKDILRSFMNDCHQFETELLDEIAPGIEKMFCTAGSGVALGTYNKHLKLYRMNTYLTRDLLRTDQLEMANQLSTELDKYKDFSATLTELNTAVLGK